MNELEHSTGTTHPDVRISATNFGPIESGIVDLRPLTVFVGPSNTGKTYFAILIYALHRIMNGFSGPPGFDMLRYRFRKDLRTDKSANSHAEVLEEEFQDVLRKLDSEERSFRFSDLPKSMRDVIQAAFDDPKLLGAALETELMRCFDLESVSDLVRFSGHPDSIKVSLDISEEDRTLWRFHLGISESGVTTNGRIEDMVLLPEGWSATKSRFSPQLNRLIKEIRGIGLPLSLHIFEELLIAAGAAGRSETHYLPAARSGIMQSHRVIASSLVARSTRAGLEHFPELPTFSGVMADFMQQLILYRENRGSDAHIRNLADAFESEALAGQIRTSRPPAGGCPEFVYRPRESEENIRLARASSMVSELAPVVLFLRGAVGRGDLLIIEEPEAHLHPAAQTRMAVTLARMVRAGVRVLVTTHSDWLLKEIGNLMREGELGRSEPTNGETLPSSLRPSEVGIWLFRKDGTSAGSIVEEIPFDRSEGVEPPDYEDVAEELYNRSANLQNQLEEREHE